MGRLRLFQGSIFFVLLCSFTSIYGQVAEKLRSIDEADTTLIYRSYASGELKLFGFYPTDFFDGLRPVIVFFHGGGWKRGTPASMAPHCKYFASRGFITFTATYGFAIENGEHSVIDCVKDAKAAVRFIYDHSHDLGIDKSDMVIGGGSAGGHLALAVAMDLGTKTNEAYLTNIRGLVLFNPVTVLTPQNQLSSRFNEEMKRREASLFAGRADIICPLSHLRRGLPPMLLMHGDKDWLLPAAQLFRKISMARENRCELRVWQGLDHGFYHIGKNENRNFVETCEETDQFLETLGLVSGKPRVQEFVDRFGERD